MRRAYDPDPDDGSWRVLVDRLWPRGVAKADLDLDQWAKELAPSAELRHEFHHDREPFAAFRQAYLRELNDNPDAPAIAGQLSRHQRLTLLYAAKDAEHNNAVVVCGWLLARAESAAAIHPRSTGDAP